MKNNLPKISIITCCYNQAHYLQETVDSVLSQTYPNIEMVVVNDGSPDNVDEVVQPYLGLSNFIYHKQSNTGLGIARNNGINISTGDWIFILDSDDIIEPDYLTQAFKLAEDEFTAIFPKFTAFTIKSKIPGHITEVLHQNDYNLGLKASIFKFTTHVSFLISRKLLLSTGLYIKEKEFQQITDWDMELKLMKSGADIKRYNPTQEKNSRFLYRYEKDSMTRTDWEINDQKYNLLMRKTLHKEVFNKVINDTYNALFNRNPLKFEKQLVIDDTSIYDYRQFLTTIIRLDRVTSAFQNILKRHPDFEGLKSHFKNNSGNIEDVFFNSREYKNNIKK